MVTEVATTIQRTVMTKHSAEMSYGVTAPVLGLARIRNNGNAGWIQPIILLPMPATAKAV